MRSLRSCLCIAALVSFVPPLFAAKQTASPLANAATDYSKEAFVLERVDALYVENADGTGYQQRTVVAKIQSDAALQQMGILTLAFAGNSQHVEFHYARVRHADGTVTETPVAGAMEQPQQVTLAAPFYSDLKQLQLPVKDLRVGDTLEWEARIVTTKSEAPNEFWGQDNFLTEDTVVREESIELRVPAAKTVTVWTNPALGAKPKETTEGDQKIYRWEDAALKPTVGAAADAERAAKKTHVLTAAEELDQEQGVLPSVAWTTFPSWAAVGAWYRGLEDGRATPDEEIKAKVAELTAGKTTDEAKVRALYAYVSTQIRYIGVAFGIGRYQPHQAVEVLHNQYGDCKDKEMLLSAMLSAAGFPSDAALIGAGVRFNEAVPSPAAFNHLITHLTLNGQDVWLDSTEEIAPYRMMLAGLRDREALVVPANGAAMLKKTPKDPPFDSFQTWAATGSLNKDGISESHIKIEERGDIELILRAAVRQIGPAQYDDFGQKLLVALGYGGTGSHVEFSRPDETDAPLTIDMDYHREKAGDWDDLKVIPQLAPVSLPAVDEKNPPVATIDLGSPRTESSTAEMKLPQGWTAELPEAVHEKSAYATYDLSYRFENGTLYSNRRLVILEEKIPATEWKNYKKFTDAIGLGNETYVQLRRPSTGSSVTAGNSAGGASGIAESLIQQAYAALRKMDDTTASGLLDQAKKLDPNARFLRAEYGFMASLRGEPSTALEDLKKELALHPDSYSVYPTAVQLELQKGDQAGAEQMLQAWTKAVPDNQKALAELAELLVAEKKPGPAVDVAKKALSLLPDEDRKKASMLQLTLGQAQTESGERDEGRATLEALLNTTDDPLITNNAAYELAESGEDLALDEQKESAVLAKLTMESKSWTMDESLGKLRATSSLLVASWDTYGWILFQEGKTREAKSYIEAAWRNTPNAELQGHLDQVNAKLGITAKKVVARSSHPLSVTTDGKSQIVIGTPEDQSSQEMRTYKLGPADGRHGVAEYRILFSRAEIERIKPTGTRELSDAETVIKRAKLDVLFPEGSDAKLMRDVMLNCSSDRCDLVLIP